MPASRRPANFAGHYRFEAWFAASGCFRGAAIDLKTGAVSFMPLDLCAARGSTQARFRLDSKLLAFSYPRRTPGRLDTRYFALNNARFTDVTQAVTKPALASINNGDSKAPSKASALAETEVTASIETQPDKSRPDKKDGSEPNLSTLQATLTPTEKTKAPSAAETAPAQQSLTFNACGTTWGYFIDGANQANVSLVLQGLDKGPTVVVHLKNGAALPELTGVKDSGPWNLDLTVSSFGQEAMSRIIYSGHMLYVSLSFDQGRNSKLALRGFGFNDTGKPCPPSPKPTAQSP